MKLLILEHKYTFDWGWMCIGAENRLKHFIWFQICKSISEVIASRYLKHGISMFVRNGFSTSISNFRKVRYCFIHKVSSEDLTVYVANHRNLFGQYVECHFCDVLGRKESCEI